MAWTGDAMESSEASSIVSAIMLEWPLKGLLGKIAHRNPFLARIDKVSNQAEFHGKYGKGVLQTVFNRNAGPRKELEDVMLPLPDDFEEVRIGIKQAMGSFGWTQEELEDAVLGDNDAVIDLIDLKTRNLPEDMRRLLNIFYAGDSTGRLARVASYNASTRVVTIDSLPADFTWKLAQWIENGMTVDILTVADITGAAAWTIKAQSVRVDQKTQALGNPTTATFRITAVDGDANSVIEASPADGDFVFLRNAVTLDSSLKFVEWNCPYGMLAIMDDGSSIGNEFHDGSVAGANGCWAGGTIWNQLRTDLDQLMCQMWRAGDWKTGGTDGTVEIASVAILQEIIRQNVELGKGGQEISALWMGGETRDWLARAAAAEHNAFRPSESGKIIPGIYTESMRTSTGRLVDIVTMSPGLPAGHIVGMAETNLTRYTKVPMGWHKENGHVIFVPGRNLTYESWMRTRYNLFGLSWGSFYIQDIDTTA